MGVQISSNSGASAAASASKAQNSLSIPDKLFAGLPKRIALFSLLFLPLIGIVTWEMVTRTQHQIIEFQARELAEVVARLSASARSAYAVNIVDKLKKDGYGSSPNYLHMPGYVPIPAQFLKFVGQRATEDSAGLYRYRPLSKWNLEPNQGLHDPFQRWAWNQLEAQDQINPVGPINWQPAWRIENMDGIKTLRYMRADPADSKACVECHNNYEQTPEIIQRRTTAGLPPRKQWSQHQLLGAIEVNVPLEKVEALATGQKQVTFTIIVSVVLAGIFIISFFVIADVSRARKIAKQLTWQTSHDALTLLINRTVFEKRLEELIARAIKDKTEHILLQLDLDQFKIINDTCGHTAGDELLCQLSALIKTKIRASDTLARLGGDEFGLLLESCSREDGLKIADTLRQMIRDYRFSWDNKTYEISVSVGIVAVNKDSENIALLMSTVDLACFSAKESGRNRVHLLEPSDGELQRRRKEMEWVSRINRAMEEKRMRLAVQDAAALDDIIRPSRYREMLLRMLDEEGKPVPTDVLISAAERYNLMPKIDRWVTRTVFEMINCGKLSANEKDLVAINLSGLTLNDDEFLQYVQMQFQAFPNVSPMFICFEITETSAIRNFNKASHFINSLRQIGCRFALDDFGSGLSSFGYLKNLHVDFLKIDGAFIRDIVNDPFDSAMVEATVKISAVMKIPTIAEWVENQEILGRIKMLGVNYAQGYGISRPQLLDP